MPHSLRKNCNLVLVDFTLNPTPRLSVVSRLYFCKLVNYFLNTALQKCYKKHRVYQLTINNFHHVSVIETCDMMLTWEIFPLWLYNICSYKLNTSNKRFYIRANICQRKREFCTQIINLLKTSLLHVHRRSGYSYIKVVYVHHTICHSVSIICQYIVILFNFSELYYHNLLNSSNHFCRDDKTPTNFHLSWI